MDSTITITRIPNPHAEEFVPSVMQEETVHPPEQEENEEEGHDIHRVLDEGRQVQQTASLLVKHVARDLLPLVEREDAARVLQSQRMDHVLNRLDLCKLWPRRYEGGSKGRGSQEEGGEGEGQGLYTQRGCSSIRMIR